MAEKYKGVFICLKLLFIFIPNRSKQMFCELLYLYFVTSGGLVRVCGESVSAVFLLTNYGAGFYFGRCL